MSIYIKNIILLLAIFSFSGSILAKNKVFYDIKTNTYWTPIIKAKNHYDAKEYCYNLTWNGHNEWALPSLVIFQNAICKDKNYSNTSGCKNPRGDSSSLLYHKGAGYSYWLINNAVKNPLKAFIFTLNKAGKYRHVNKTTKQIFRCVDVRASKNITNTKTVTTTKTKSNVGGAYSKSNKDVFYDAKTDVYWTSVIKKKTFYEAKKYCENLSWYGINKWTLPSFELFKNTICEDKDYDNETGCQHPRTEDPLSVLSQEGAGTKYWMKNTVPKNPSKAYLFGLDKQGKYSLSDKRKKQYFRCITREKSNTILAKDEALNYRYNMIISGYYGMLWENLINTQTYGYDSLNARFSIYLGQMSIDFNHNLVVEFDIGASATDKAFFDMPNIITLLANWEMVWKKRFALRLGLGMAAAVVPVDIRTSPYMTITAETQYGLAWNAGLSVVLVQFGQYNRFSIILDGKYTGVKTSRFFGNMLSIGAGFGWKFKII